MMSLLIEIVLTATVAGLLMARRASGTVWALVAGAWLVWLSGWRDVSALLLMPMWLAYLGLVFVLLPDGNRRRWISAPARRLLARALPPMSDTERQALEAGTVWWDGDLFSGDPDWHRLLETPTRELTDEERAFVEGPTDTLCNMIDDWDITHHRYDLPEPVWQYLKEQGFFGMIIPKRYGGLEFSARAHSDVVMKVAARSITAAVTVMVPNSLGPAKLLLHYGTEEQKNHYLPRLARGEDIPCFALTGPEAGSDAASIPDTGIVCRSEFNGRPDVLGIRLNWDKRYITLGPVATLLGLAFHLYDPDHLLGETEDIGITLALIPTDTPGVEIGNRHFPLNIVFQNGPTRGRDVFIPMDWVIGGQDRVGQGWTMLMECLADGRSISLPALSVGSGKLASRATGAYAAVRKQFKLPIGRFEGVSEVLARIAGSTYLMDAARTLTCTALDQGEKPSVISAIVKYHLTERMRRIINDAMDIHGGSGICLGPRNILGRGYQAIPIGITVEGANILTRNLIIFGQGAMRCHPYILQEMEAASSPDTERGIRDFDTALFAHIRHALSNAVRALFHGLTGARFAPAPVGDASARYYRQFTRMSAAFAILADAAMLRLGGELKRRERLSARLGDALSHLYLGSAALKRFQDQGCKVEDVPLMRWACEDSLFNIQQSLLAMLDNFPDRFMAPLLKRLVFPFGPPYHAPDDRLNDAVSALVLQPGQARDRLTDGLFLPTDLASEPLARLEDALVKATAAEGVLHKIRQAQRDGRLKRADPEQQLEAAVAGGVIAAAEADIVTAAIEARRAVIQVDDFTPEQLRGESSQWTSSEVPREAAARST